MSGLQEYQQQFTRFIRTRQTSAKPRGVDAKRIRIYAGLVFNNIHQTVSACFPVARKVLGERRWKRLIRAFLAEHPCATPIFRQIPEEFLHWLESAQEIPAWLPSLAHYEWVELAVAVADTPDIPQEYLAPQGDLLQGHPVLAPVLMLLRYPFAVQRISQSYQPMAPDAEPTHILAFRRDHFEVKFMELNAVSARLVSLLRETDKTGAQVLQQIAGEMHHPDPDVVLRGGLQVLENLREERAVLGTARQ